MEPVVSDSTTLDSVREIVKVQTSDWIERCRQFLRWERAEMFQKNATQQTRACHRRSLEFLLKMTENIESVIAEAGEPDPESKAELASMRHRLNESWQAFYNPLPKSEADQILAKVFPE